MFLLWRLPVGSEDVSCVDVFQYGPGHIHTAEAMLPRPPPNVVSATCTSSCPPVI